MRRLVIAGLTAVLLLPLATRAEAAPCAKCLLLGSDSGAGFHDPGSFYLRAAGTALEYRDKSRDVNVIEYVLVAAISYEQSDGLLIGRGPVQIFARGATSPRYEFTVDAVAVASAADTTFKVLRPDWVFTAPVSANSPAVVAGVWKHIGGSAYRGEVSIAAP